MVIPSPESRPQDIGYVPSLSNNYMTGAMSQWFVEVVTQASPQFSNA
jgi:hypothetical protein